MIQVTPAIAINEKEIQEEFVHASGPGGQNVNKVATAVQLRFDITNSPGIPEDVKKRLRGLAGRKVTGAGILIIDARRFRTQEQNRIDARQRLIRLIEKAAQTPKERHKTRPTNASRRRRQEEKQHRGEIKRLRRKTLNTDDI